jgi:uncharacterized membrane protein
MIERSQFSSKTKADTGGFFSQLGLSNSTWIMITILVVVVVVLIIVALVYRKQLEGFLEDIGLKKRESLKDLDVLFFYSPNCQFCN